MASERKGAKAERLEARLTRSAQPRLTDFLVCSAMKAAEDVPASPHVFEISTREGWAALTHLLYEPRTTAPNAKLVALPRTYRAGEAARR